MHIEIGENETCKKSDVFTVNEACAHMGICKTFVWDMLIFLFVFRTDEQVCYGKRSPRHPRMI